MRKTECQLQLFYPSFNVNNYQTICSPHTHTHIYMKISGVQCKHVTVSIQYKIGCRRCSCCRRQMKYKIHTATPEETKWRINCHNTDTKKLVKLQSISGYYIKHFVYYLLISKILLTNALKKKTKAEKKKKAMTLSMKITLHRKL